MNVQIITQNPHLIIYATNILESTKFNAISKVVSTMCNRTLTHRGFSGDSTSKNFSVDYFMLGDIFSSIHLTLLQHTNKNLTLTGFSIHLNRRPPDSDWHFHEKAYTLDPSEFNTAPDAYVAIFYLHPVWDKQYGGNLLIGKEKNNPIASCICEPNSCVIHSADLSHGVDWIDLDSFSTMERIVMYSHWVKL